MWVGLSVRATIRPPGEPDGDDVVLQRHQVAALAMSCSMSTLSRAPPGGTGVAPDNTGLPAMPGRGW